MSAESDTDRDPDDHTELVDMVADINLSANRVTLPNGNRVAPGKRHRLTMSDRKLSLQERSTFQASGRTARRPTIESNRVSISDGEVRGIQEE